MAQPLISLIESKIRLFWSRLGAALERSIGPRSSQAFDLAAVLDSAEREIENKVRREGDRMIAPNRVEVRFDYETHARMTDLQRETLLRSLQSALSEFVHNRRYATADAFRVRVEVDAFVRRITVQATFTEVAEPAALTGASPRGGASLRLILRTRSANRKRELQAVLDGTRSLAGLGRSRDNALVLDHESASNFHASFSLRSDGTLWLSDLGSTNGTTIDGVPLTANESREVRGGERMRFGDVEFLLEVRGE